MVRYFCYNGKWWGRINEHDTLTQRMVDFNLHHYYPLI